jgi:hypothetical protein
LHDAVGNERPIAERPPSAGVEDLVIVPLVLIALAISKLLKGVLSILIYVLDYAFPILLQLVRIPLLTAQLIGDGMELLFEGGVRCLPVSGAKRDAWRARVRQQWSGSGATSATRPSSMRSTMPLKPEWRGCSENAED